MVNFFFNFFIFFLIFFLLKFLTFKYSFLISQSGENHQKLVSRKSIPTIGGMLLMVYFVIYKDFLTDNFIFLLLPLFLLGLIADLKILKSPKFRLIIQVLIIILVVNYFNLIIRDVRIDFLNFFLTKDIPAIFFSSFCILVLLNGSNFIDGLNGLVLILYFIIFNFLFYLDLISFLNLSYQAVIILNLIFLIMILLNLSNQIYLGDNGVYVISIFFSYLIIKSHQNNIYVSPYFYAVLFWYPAFENLFSIIRKIINKKSPDIPDNFHLHHFIYMYLKSKYPTGSVLFINNFSGLLISLFNFLIIYFASKYIFSTKFLIIILAFCCFFYLGLYFFLLKFLKKNF